MTTLQLALESLEQKPARRTDVDQYSRENFHRSSWTWDRLVKGSQPTNCGYQRSCKFNLYVKDGVVLREEPAANYPTGMLEGATGLPVDLHLLNQQREHVWRN